MPSLSLQNLLWSTRGNNWGFRFVHQPETNPGQWEEIYQGIFGRDDRVPKRWHGLVVLPDGTELKYVASRFFDPEATWKDMSGREIPQEMFVVIGSTSSEEIINIAWEYAVMNQVRGYYMDAYNKSSIAIKTLQVRSEDVELPLTPSSVNATRLDIKLGAQGSYEKTSFNSGPNDNIKFPGNVRRILNMDVMELIGSKK